MQKLRRVIQAFGRTQATHEDGGQFVCLFQQVADLAFRKYLGLKEEFEPEYCLVSFLENDP